MKRILTLLALICAFNSNAQTADSTAYYRSIVDTMTIAFTAPVGTECYVAHYVEDPAVTLQVALATQGVNFSDTVLQDDSYKATITVKGSTIVKCFEVLRNMPEGFAAEENKKLLTALMPIIATRYPLAYVINSMRLQNVQTVLDIKRSGAGKVKNLQKLLD